MTLKQNKKINQKGFTLIELLVVITIMGVLGTLLITNYTKYIDKSKQVVVDEQLSEIVKTFEIAFVDGTEYNDIVLSGYNVLKEENFNLKEAFQTISGSKLPTESTLVIDDDTLKYTYNGKTASYNYA